AMGHAISAIALSQLSQSIMAGDPTAAFAIPTGRGASSMLPQVGTQDRMQASSRAEVSREAASWRRQQATLGPDSCVSRCGALAVAVAFGAVFQRRQRRAAPSILLRAQGAFKVRKGEGRDAGRAADVVEETEDPEEFGSYRSIPTSRISRGFVNEVEGMNYRYSDGDEESDLENEEDEFEDEEGEDGDFAQGDFEEESPPQEFEADDQDLGVDPEELLFGKRLPFSELGVK
ncbi:unnamed protein product, partial [Polarella glacialis]